MARELSITIQVSDCKHPNIVSFFGASSRFPAADECGAEWSIGLVFELCDPYDLYHLLHTYKIKLSVSQKLQLARGCAAGLACLHSLNILHCDFGSRNLLIKDRHVKITDFGIARRLPCGHTHCQPGAVSGTLQWMSPEQIQGKRMSAKSDVFSLGTTPSFTHACACMCTHQLRTPEPTISAAGRACACQIVRGN
jgi:serine/threonine protein kinase